MVDLQAHVLPGADRGAADEAEALAMCRHAAERGTKEIVAAPKTDLSQPWDPAEADAALARLQQALGETIHLHRGCEVKLTWANAEQVCADPSRYTLNGRQYLLVEVSSELLEAEGLGKLFGRLRDLGAIPIISTPERNTRLRSSTRRLKHWLDRGALAQVCGGSLTGLFGEKTQAAAIGLIDANLAQFVVSDGHNLETRPPDLLEAWDFLVYRWGPAKARELLIDNPWRALWGEKLEARPGRIRKAPSLRRAFLGRKRRSAPP